MFDTTSIKKMAIERIVVQKWIPLNVWFRRHLIVSFQNTSEKNKFLRISDMSSSTTEVLVFLYNLCCFQNCCRMKIKEFQFYDKQEKKYEEKIIQIIIIITSKNLNYLMHYFQDKCNNLIEWLNAFIDLFWVWLNSVFNVRIYIYANMIMFVSSCAINSSWTMNITDNHLGNPNDQLL